MLEGFPGPHLAARCRRPYSAEYVCHDAALLLLRGLVHAKELRHKQLHRPVAGEDIAIANRMLRVLSSAKVLNNCAIK